MNNRKFNVEEELKELYGDFYEDYYEKPKRQQGNSLGIYTSQGWIYK